MSTTSTEAGGKPVEPPPGTEVGGRILGGRDGMTTVDEVMGLLQDYDVRRAALLRAERVYPALAYDERQACLDARAAVLAAIGAALPPAGFREAIVAVITEARNTVDELAMRGIEEGDAVFCFALEARLNEIPPDVLSWLGAALAALPAGEEGTP